MLPVRPPARISAATANAAHSWCRSTRRLAASCLAVGASLQLPDLAFNLRWLASTMFIRLVPDRPVPPMNNGSRRFTPPPLPKRDTLASVLPLAETHFG